MNKIENFRVFVNKVLPTVYDDSLSYYELLNKVVHYLNTTIDQVNGLTDGFTKLLTEVVPENVEEIMVKWSQNGVLENLVNVSVLNRKAEQTDLLEVDTLLQNTITQIANIITTPAVGVSEQEIVDARQSEVSLGTNLSKIKTNMNNLDFSNIKVNPIPIAGGFDNLKTRSGYMTLDKVGNTLVVTKPDLSISYSDGVQTMDFTPNPNKLVHVRVKGTHNVTTNKPKLFIWGANVGFLDGALSYELPTSFDKDMVFDPTYYSIYKNETKFHAFIISDGMVTPGEKIVLEKFDVIQSDVLDTEIKGINLENVIKNVDVKLSTHGSRISALEGGTVSDQNIYTSPDGTKYISIVQNTGAIVGSKLHPDKVLMLGNSLMFGWNMEFGMSATNSQSDYYHHVKEKIKEYKPSAAFTKLYTSPWESEAIARPTFITDNLNPVLTADTDLVVIQAGENVAQAGISKFQTDGITLVRHIRSIANKARVLFVGVWYPDTPKVNAIQEICRQTGAMFCNISDIYSPETTGKIGDVITYDNDTTTTITLESQASHPGNLGMQMIADRIIASLGLSQ